VAIEALDNLAAAVVNRATLIPVKIDLPHLLLQFRQRLAGVVFGGSVFFEKIYCHAIDKIIPGLCRQDECDEELQRIGEI
jgi:hypothetical protein